MIIFFLIIWHAAAFPSTQVSSTLNSSMVIAKALYDLTVLSLSSLMPRPTPQVTQNCLKVFKETMIIHIHPGTFWPIHQHVKTPTFPLQLFKTQPLHALPDCLFLALGTVSLPSFVFQLLRNTNDSIMQ